jgi:hypothetical protein
MGVVEKEMRKLSISEMKARSKDFFFSKSTTRFFRGSKNKAVYDKKTKRNYIRVTGPSGRNSWYRFKDNGKTDYVTFDKLPRAIKKRWLGR